MFNKSIILTAFLFLSACAATGVNNYKIPPEPNYNHSNFSPAYYKIKTPIQCVPHARKVSGIPIRGNAHTWWTQAAGKYQRSARPKVGAVMVLSKTKRLRYGHIAVVKRIVDSRNIEVEHANWGGTRSERAIIYTRMPVKDVSANNDWSRSRFWNYPSKSYGSIYPVSGFIYPNQYNKNLHQPVEVQLRGQHIIVPAPTAKPVVPRSMLSNPQGHLAPIPPLKPIY